MTVNTTNITSGPYSGNDVADTFSYTFRVTDESQLVVYETDDTGAVTELTLNTDYTVNSTGDDDGGTITRTAGALPSDYTWYIRADYDATQDTAFQSQGAFFPDLHENAMDKLTFLIQQILDGQSRTPKLSDFYSGTLPLSMEDPESGKILTWNSTGTGIENGELSFSSSDEFAVASLAALKALTGSFDGQIVFLSAGGRSGPFSWDSSDLSEEVSVDTQEGYYVAPSSDDTGASGAWVRITVLLTAEMFGASVSSINNETELQAAIDMSAYTDITLDTGNTGKVYAIDGPLYVRSNSRIVGNATFNNTNTSADINSVVLMPGGFNPAYFDDYTYHSATAVATDGITLSVASASSYSVGDLIWVVSDEKWTGNAGDYPVFAQLAEILSVTASTVTIDHPLSEDIFTKYSGVSICQAEDSSVTDLLGNPLEFCRNASIDGISIKSSVGSVIARGGMYKCDFKFSEIDGKNIVFANAFCRTNVIVKNLTSSRKMMDVAGNSHDFNIVVENSSYQYNASVSESISYCRAGECSRDGNIKIKNMNANGYIFGQGLCQVDSGCHRVKMTVDNGVALDHTGDVVKLNQSTTTGTQLQLEDCEIKAKFELGGGCSRGAWMNSTPGDQYMIRCGFDVQLTNGTYSTGYAVQFDGTDSYCNGHCNSGAVRLGSDVEGAVVRGYFAEGVSSVEANNDILISSDAGNESKVGNTRQNLINITATASGTENLSVTFPGNSLSAGDRWKIPFTGEKIGTAGTTNISFSDDDGDSIDFSIAAATQGEFNGYFEVIVQNDTRYTLYGFINFEGGITVADYIDSVEDLTSASTFTVEAWKGDGADTMRFHALDSNTDKLYHN